MNPINPNPGAADLLDRTARAASGDIPVDVGAVLERVRSHRRRRATRAAAGTALVLVAALVAAGGLVPRLGALPPPVGSGPEPQDGAVRLPALLREPRLDPPPVISRDGTARARQLSAGLTAVLRGQEVPLGVDAATGRLVRLPATDDDLPGIGVPTGDLSGSFPRTRVVLSPGGTVVAVVTLHRDGCRTVLVDLGRRRVLPSAGVEPCAADAGGLARWAAAVLPMDDGSLVRPGPNGDTLRRQTPPEQGVKGAPPRWDVQLPDLDGGGTVTLEALNAGQALVRTTNGEGRRTARLLDLSTGRLGPALADLAVVAGAVVRPDPAGPLWYLTQADPVLLRRDTVGADGGTELAVPAVPLPDGVLGNPVRVVGVNAGQAVLAAMPSTRPDTVAPVVGRWPVLVRLDPGTGQETGWVEVEGALQASGWSLPVALLGRAEVVPAPDEPWWALLAPLSRVTFWSWPGLLLLALVGLPGMITWRRTRRTSRGGGRKFGGGATRTTGGGV